MKNVFKSLLASAVVLAALGSWSVKSAQAQPLHRPSNPKTACPMGGGGSTPTPTPTPALPPSNWQFQIEATGTKYGNPRATVSDSWETGNNWTQSGNWSATYDTIADTDSTNSSGTTTTGYAHTEGYFRVVCTYMGDPSNIPSTLNILVTPKVKLYYPPFGTLAQKLPMPSNLTATGTDGYSTTFTTDDAAKSYVITGTYPLSQSTSGYTLDSNNHPVIRIALPNKVSLDASYTLPADANPNTHGLISLSASAAARENN